MVFDPPAVIAALIGQVEDLPLPIYRCSHKVTIDDGYNNNGHDSHNNHGGYNNHNSNKAELRRAHREIKRLFMDAENAYYPFFMNSQDKRRMGRALRRLSGELSNLVTIVRKSYRSEVREVKRVVENARFALVSECDANRAHKKLQRAERRYNQMMDEILY